MRCVSAKSLRGGWDMHHAVVEGDSVGERGDLRGELPGGDGVVEGAGKLPRATWASGTAGAHEDTDEAAPLYARSYSREVPPMSAEMCERNCWAVTRRGTRCRRW